MAKENWGQEQLDRLQAWNFGIYFDEIIVSNVLFGGFVIFGLTLLFK